MYKVSVFHQVWGSGGGALGLNVEGLDDQRGGVEAACRYLATYASHFVAGCSICSIVYAVCLYHRVTVH